MPTCTGGQGHTPAAPGAELVLARDLLLMTACSRGNHVCRMELLVLSSLDDDNMAMACHSPRLSCLPSLLLHERSLSPRESQRDSHPWVKSCGRASRGVLGSSLVLELFLMGWVGSRGPWLACVWNGKDEDDSMEEKRGSISLEKSKSKGLDVKMTAMLACHISKILLIKRYGPVMNQKSR